MFVYSQDDKSSYKYLMKMVVLLPKFSWSWYKVGMNWKTVNTSRIFHIEFVLRVTLPTFSPQGHWLIAVWTWAAETRVSGWCQNFHKIIICIKNFLFQKDNCSSCEFWNFPIRYWQPLGKLSSLHPASGIWAGIILIWNVTP